MRILMCPPDYFNVNYKINPWMNTEEKVDRENAFQQWNHLRDTIEACGAQVVELPPAKGWPDMVFTANAGIMYQGKLILSRYRYKERQGEIKFVKAWFREAGIEIIDVFQEHPDLYFEGGGDTLLAGDKVFAGYGYRTDKEFYQYAPFDKDKLTYCRLANSAYYHLDTCFCPLNANVAIWYPDAFDDETKRLMSSEIELIEVSEIEAKHFACNAIAIDNHIIIPKNCPDISATLEARGFKVHACDMSEFLKAGGACKCLVLSLD